MRALVALRKTFGRRRACGGKQALGPTGLSADDMLPSQDESSESTVYPTEFLRRRLPALIWTRLMLAPMSWAVVPRLCCSWLACLLVHVKVTSSSSF